ncbi:hypothetical protein N9L18_00675 [Candidatus Pacebacteria bacterium]|nr:hypothetical protein [Candidatus Paceibacterota bacterium]
MATGAELKNISRARIKTSDTLIEAKDWDGAAQMMGLALECALKSVICKTLNLSNYPESHKDGDIPKLFMCHKFDRLALLGGLDENFSSDGDKDVFQNWSEFTSNYTGEWVAMRYNDEKYSSFDEKTTKRIRDSLEGNDDSIIGYFEKNKKW